MSKQQFNYSLQQKQSKKLDWENKMLTLQVQKLNNYKKEFF